MNEKIIKFGPEKNMLGIVSEPESNGTDDKPGKPAILLLNSGLIHKVGPYRMSVELARKLAQQGYLVLRFDLPNIGDSRSYKTTQGYRERTITEISSAMDAVTKRYKIASFISIGLCTGAMNSHVITLSDDRVKGAVMLDAYAYPTLQFLIKRYANKLYKVFYPKVILEKITALFESSEYESDVGQGEGIEYWLQPTKKEIADDLLSIMSRDVNLLYIYSGGANEIYNYEGQFSDTFKSIDFKNNLNVRLLYKMDHTYTLKNDRDYMLNVITSWVEQKFNR